MMFLFWGHGSPFACSLVISGKITNSHRIYPILLGNPSSHKSLHVGKDICIKLLNVAWFVIAKDYKHLKLYQRGLIAEKQQPSHS